MFSRRVNGKLRNPRDGNGFGDIWGSLIQTAVQVGGTAYTAGISKDIEEAKLNFQREQSAANAEIEKTRLAIQQKQVDLLAQANEKPSMMDSVSALTTPTNLALLGGAAVGVGLIVYLLTRKK